MERQLNVFQFPEAATGDVLQNKCSKKFPKFHRKISVLESLFNKVPCLATLLRRYSNIGVFL